MVPAADSGSNGTSRMRESWLLPCTMKLIDSCSIGFLMKGQAVTRCSHETFDTAGEPKRPWTKR